MPSYFRWGIGPLRFSQRLGRTEAQKRAAARQRQEERERRRAIRDAQRPEAIARREEYQRQLEDHDARTHRAVVSECRIDPLKGGSFTIEGENLTMTFNVAGEDGALHFLSLRKGDVVDVTLSAEDAGVEEFQHLARANGAKPRSPVNFDDIDMQWLGLTATGSESGGQT
jgi:hypothetical protein